MSISERPWLIGLGAIWMVFLFAGLESSLFAMKPVPTSESKYCRKLKQQYYHFKDLFEKAEASYYKSRNAVERKRLKEEGRRWKQRTLNFRDEYRLNCKGKKQGDSGTRGAPGNCTPRKVDANCAFYDWVWWSRAGRHSSCRDPQKRARIMYNKKTAKECYKECSCVKRR